MTQTQDPNTRASQKRKARAKLSTIFSTTTIRHLPFAYFHLTLISPGTIAKPATTTAPIDLLTVRTHLTSALTQFLGITGAATSVDILRVEGRDAWIRVSFEDRAAVTEAISGWVGSDVAWKIKESGSWLGGMVGSNGHDLFDI